VHVNSRERAERLGRNVRCDGCNLQVRVTFSAAGCVLSSSGTVLEQAGHLEVWQEARHIRSRYPANKSDANDDKDNAAGSGREDSATGSGALDGTDEDPESESTADGSHYKALASLKMGAEVALTAAEVRTYETAPPGMFQEASLVKALEQLGIGRPATYASTISTLLDRYATGSLRVGGGRGELVQAAFHSEWQQRLALCGGGGGGEWCFVFPFFGAQHQSNVCLKPTDLRIRSTAVCVSGEQFISFCAFLSSAPQPTQLSYSQSHY
jgi:hypothetical protein